MPQFDWKEVQAWDKYYYTTVEREGFSCDLKIVNDDDHDFSVEDPEAEGYMAFGIICEAQKIVERKLPDGETLRSTIPMGWASAWDIELCYGSNPGLLEVTRYENFEKLDEIAQNVLVCAIEDAKANLAELRK